MRALEFLLILLVFLLFVVEASAVNQKMIKTFGKVLDVDLFDTETRSNKECVDFCFTQSDCILVFMNLDEECLLFGFNNTEKLTVVETTREEGLMVAFKIRFPFDECPEYNQLDFVVDVGEDPITWQRNGDILSFTKCVGGWKMFERSDSKLICMQVFYFEEAILKEDAKIYCEEKGYKLTGVGSAKETRWILDRVLFLLPEISTYRGFWLDGVRNCSEWDSNCPSFSWSDGYTTGNAALNDSSANLSGWNYGSTARENCLTVAKMENPLRTVNDVVCGGSGYEIGVVCGYQLM